ncbi:hypothetical protein ACFPOI_50785 [Nonomuraea angiospora]|uniref:Fibronectin type-III domain-containing protein n=1 Tax=Nonomuraea angiospora TaxID=46172 RepID=A0ABR9M186_9ACTN|nr:hypothetical protein [Nonomuraea angiospora]MBE1586643.1 hypothetical protein [Nonomuraea angiospora]
MVPVGAGVAASSLDSGFERQDVVELLRTASATMVDELPDNDIRVGVDKVASVLGRNRPKARAVSSVSDRLNNVRLKDGPVRVDLATFLSGSYRDLSNPAEWTAELAAVPGLDFSQWPLTEPETVAVDQVRVDPFLREKDAVVKSSRLKQDNPGDLPYTEAGEESPAVVRVTWKTVPAKSDAIYRWLVEVLPPEDLSDGDDTGPKAKVTAAGSRRTATVEIKLNESDLEHGSLFVVRVTGLDTAGQPVLLQGREGELAQDESATPRWPAQVPAYGELLFKDGSTATAFRANGRMGVVLQAEDTEPVEDPLPTALSKQRKEIHALLGAHQARWLVESLDWTEELRDKVRSYCQSYKNALDRAATDANHPDDRPKLTSAATRPA